MSAIPDRIDYLPNYRCRRCGKLFLVFHPDEPEVRLNDSQMKEVITTLNGAPFMQPQLRIKQFVTHSNCELNFGNDRVFGVGIGELAGFTTKKVYK